MSSLSLLVDASGNPLAGTFGKPLPTANIAGASTGTSAGVAVGGLNPQSLLTPVGIDAYGALTIRPGVCPTHSSNSASPVPTGTAAGKSMLSMFNASTTTWQRVAAIIALCPPQINTSGGLLGIGSGTSYTSIYFGIYRITGHSGGTSLTPVMADPADDSILDPGFTVRVGATVTGLASAPSYTWDAAYNGLIPVGPRPDLCMKVWTMPPGYGLVVRNLNAVSTSIGFMMNVTCAQNIA